MARGWQDLNLQLDSVASSDADGLHLRNGLSDAHAVISSLLESVITPCKPASPMPQAHFYISEPVPPRPCHLFLIYTCDSCKGLRPCLLACPENSLVFITSALSWIANDAFATMPVSGPCTAVLIFDFFPSCWARAGEGSAGSPGGKGEWTR